MAVLGSNTLNHSADLLIQRAGTTKLQTTSGGIQIFKNAHASGASDFHLELFSSNINAANEVSLRMHQSGQWFGQIRLRSDGFHFTDGGNNNYRNIFFGTATASGTVTGPTFNATSTTSGGFQGIDADGVSTPSFTWSGDLTTGIYRATTSDVGITGGGVVRARFGGSILLYKNTFVLPVDDVAADGTTTTRASGTLNWRGKYWNGTSSVNTDWNIIYVPTNTSGAGDFRIRNGGTTRLTVNNSGTVTAATFSGALSGNATTATTATNANKINRNGILASNTSSFRVLLGAASDNSGFQDCHVVTDASRLFYQPSSNTLTCGTFAGALSGNATTATTATNANQLGGHVRQSGAATANTVAGRDGSGDIYARLIRQTFANQTTISGGMVFRVNDSTDNYLRVCSDTAAIRTFLNVPTRTGGNASGTWAIAITGNAATVTNGVYTSGNQTIGGTKTFNNDIISALGARIISGSPVTIGLSGESGSVSNPSIQANGTGTNTGAILVSSYSSSDSGPQFIMMKSNSGTIGTLSRALSGDFLGRLRWRAANTTSTIEEGARISVRADGNWTSTSCPTRMQFSLCASGSTSATVRFQLFANRVKTAQRLDANTDSTPFTSTNSIFSGTGAGSNTGNVALETWGTSTATRFHISFSNPNGVVGSISTNGTTTAFNTTSDYRLKENILPLENALERIRQLSVYRFNFIGEPNKIVDGFLAHEVKNIIPESISGEKDEIVDIGKIVASDGTIIKENVNEPDSEELLVDNYEWIKTGESPVYQGIDQSKIVPLLTAALQEAIEKIETLEVRVSQLEAS
jgi:hypothetical protein